MLVGQQIGPFAIEKELGSGAMGTVYLATFTETGGKCAVKMINPAVLGNTNTVARFERETAILKKLNHPNIVRLFASGRYHKTPFYAMEFVEGESLDRILHRRGRFNWEEVVHLGKQVCAALQHAHEQGIIHRDLKPANILMMRDGTAKLADFGIAKGLDADQLTATNCAVGTAAYMSPEQCRGEKRLTPRSDLYSFGVMLYELLTGRLPFPAENTLDMFLAHTQGDFERPSRRVLDIPIWLDTLVCQCLEKDPDERPLDAAMVAKSLDMVIEKVAAQKSAGVELVSTRAAQLRKTLKTNHEDLEAARTLHAAVKKTKTRRRVRPIQERRWFQGLVLLGALAVVAGVVAVFWYASRPPSAEGLYRRAKTLMASADANDWKKAREEPIAKYLEYYGGVDNEQTTEVRQWADKVDANVREAQLHNRIRLNVIADDPAEKKARSAVQQEEQGDWDAALERWQELLPLKKDADQNTHAWGLLAAKHVQDLQDLAQKQMELRRRVKQARDRLEEPKAESDLDKHAILATRYELFGDLSAALQSWQDLRNRLSDEDEGWRLRAMHEIHALQPKLPAGDEVDATRRRVIAQHLARATSKTSYNPQVSYAECQDIIDLYGGDSNRDIKQLVAAARKQLAKSAKELNMNSPARKERESPHETDTRPQR